MKQPKTSFDEILQYEVPSEECTILQYFEKLLTRLMIEEEGFSGKRPFGDSGWKYDLYIPLIKNGIIKGKIDEDGYVDSVDKEAGNRILLKLVEHVFTP